MTSKIPTALSLAKQTLRIQKYKQKKELHLNLEDLQKQMINRSKQGYCTIQYEYILPQTIQNYLKEKGYSVQIVRYVNLMYPATDKKETMEISWYEKYEELK
jgi:hypothetical protein